MSATEVVGQTYDCAPFMTDEQVWDFCRRGYLLLEAAVDDEINRVAERRLNETLSSLFTTNARPARARMMRD